MPRIFVIEENRLWQGWGDESHENYDLCKDCFDELEEGEDYYDSSRDEALHIIIEQAEGERPYDCEHCNKALTEHNY